MAQFCGLAKRALSFSASSGEKTSEAIHWSTGSDPDHALLHCAWRPMFLHPCHSQKKTLDLPSSALALLKRRNHYLFRRASKRFHLKRLLVTVVVCVMISTCVEREETYPLYVYCHWQSGRNETEHFSQFSEDDLLHHSFYTINNIYFRCLPVSLYNYLFNIEPVSMNK